MTKVLPMKKLFTLPPKQLAVLALITANIIWGAASPIFKWSLVNVPIFVMAYLRFFGALLLLIPFVWKTDLKIHRHDWLPIIGIAFFGITVNITFFFLGLKNAPSVNAPIIASSGPIFLIFFSCVFLKEKLKTKTLIGTLISLFGVIVIVSRSLFEQGFAWSTTIGNLFFVLATLGAVAHTIFSKEMLHKYSPFAITFWSFVIGALTFFPLFFIQMQSSSWQNIFVGKGLVGLLFGIILSSTLAYFLYEWGVEKIHASEVGVFTYIDPVIAAVIAIPLLGEVITPLFILGSCLVFVGIFISEGRIHYHPFHKLRLH